MKKLLMIFKWLIPAAFIVPGVFCYFAENNHKFLALIFFCLSGLSLCYLLISLLRPRKRLVAKMLRTVLSTIVCIGILVFAVTEVIILSASTGDPEEDCAYVIVLGARVRGTTPSLSLESRIDAAYDYLTTHPKTIGILSGGQGPDEDISEAQCMFERLTAKGIASERLWLEDQSTSTWENLRFSMALIAQNTDTQPKKIGLLSSEFHLYRAGLFAKACGVEAVGIPAKTPMPTMRLNYFLREVAGVWHYLILGGQYND